MIRAVKSKAEKAAKNSLKNPNTPIVIFKRRLYKLYTKYPLNNNATKTNYKRLVKNNVGDYLFKISKKTKMNNSNYLSYVHRASNIMDENAIKLQIRNHSKIFNKAINKHLTKVKERTQL